MKRISIFFTIIILACIKLAAYDLDYIMPTPIGEKPEEFYFIPNYDSEGNIKDYKMNGGKRCEIKYNKEGQLQKKTFFTYGQYKEFETTYTYNDGRLVEELTQTWNPNFNDTQTKEPFNLYLKKYTLNKEKNIQTVDITVYDDGEPEDDYIREDYLSESGKIDSSFIYRNYQDNIKSMFKKFYYSYDESGRLISLREFYDDYVSTYSRPAIFTIFGEYDYKYLSDNPVEVSGEGAQQMKDFAEKSEKEQEAELRALKKKYYNDLEEDEGYEWTEFETRVIYDKDKTTYRMYSKGLSLWRKPMEANFFTVTIDYDEKGRPIAQKMVVGIDRTKYSSHITYDSHGQSRVELDEIDY